MAAGDFSKTFGKQRAVWAQPLHLVTSRHPRTETRRPFSLGVADEPRGSRNPARAEKPRSLVCCVFLASMRRRQSGARLSHATCHGTELGPAVKDLGPTDGRRDARRFSRRSY
jgi:hypothetical protein